MATGVLFLCLTFMELVFTTRPQWWHAEQVAIVGLAMLSTAFIVRAYYREKDQ